jgi:hypothetical protein
MFSVDRSNRDQDRATICVASVSASVFNGRPVNDVTLPPASSGSQSASNAFRTPPYGMGNASRNLRIPKSNGWIFSSKDLFRMWLRGVAFTGGGGIILVRISAGF